MKAKRSPAKASRKAAHLARKARRKSIRKVKAPQINEVVLEGLEQIQPRAAGIDVGSKENYVCVPAHLVKPGEETVRAFGVFTPDMDATVEWLQACGITTVAMEATGIYWVSLYDKLEAVGIEVVLVEPSSVKHVPGRKSDVMDCQWLQRLHSYGLLRASFRPAAPVRKLRTLTRQRAEVVCRASAHIEEMQKAMVQMNVQLHLVVSDINGETGLRIIEAILQGERDPEVLVRLRDKRCKKSTVAEMEAALKGNYTEELLFVLGQTLEAWKFCQKQLAECDEQVVKLLKDFPSAPVVAVAEPPPRQVPPSQDESTKKNKRKRAGGNNALGMELGWLGEQLARICGVDLTAVCGLNLLSVLMLIAEIGVDMSRWRSAKAFCSWLGLCPGTKISGGRILSRRSRHVVSRASLILRMAAMALGRSDTWLGRFYRRKKAHLGAPKAITATARKLACVIYHMLKYRENYVPLDVAIYDLQAQERRQQQLRNQAAELGFELVPKKQVA
jgi:transposase